MLLLEYNQHWVGKSSYSLHWDKSHYPAFDYLLTTAQQLMFYSLHIFMKSQ